MSKTLVIGVIVGVVGLFALGGFLLWQNVSNQVTQTPASPPPASAPLPQPQASDNEDFILSEVEGWQTYRNDEFGFEMKYPNTWEVEIDHAQAVTNIQVFGPSLDDRESTLIDSRLVQIYPITIVQQEKTVEEIVYEFYHESKRKDLQIEKSIFQGFPSVIARVPRGISPGSMHAVLKDRHLYTFPLQFTSDQILSTFRFTP